MEFGKKEHVLNYACQLYQLSRPSRVGAVLALIRECQPSSYEEWKKWYFENAYTVYKTRAEIGTQAFLPTTIRKGWDMGYREEY